MLRQGICALLLSASALAALPTQVPARSVTLQKTSDDGTTLIWQSPSFEIHTYASIAPDEVKKIAVIAETTFWVLKNHPLPLARPPAGQRARVEILQHTLDYQNAGGIPGSAGCYHSRHARLLIDGSHYFASALRAGKRLPPANLEDLLVHELVHLCMHGHMGLLPAWFTEGIAEYFSCMHTSGGNFVFSHAEASVRDHLRARYQPDKPDITVRPIAEIAVLDSHDWLRTLQHLPAEERYHAYATALLLVHYHLHGGKPRLQNVAEILKTSAQQQRRPRPVEFPLDATAISKSLPGFWKTKGLAIHYAR